LAGQLPITSGVNIADQARASDEGFLLVTPTADIQLQSVAAGRTGQLLCVRKVGTANALDVVDDGGGTAANQFGTANDGSIRLRDQRESILAVYDVNRWQVISPIAPFCNQPTDVFGTQLQHDGTRWAKQAFSQYGNGTGLPATGDIRKGTDAALNIVTGSHTNISATGDVSLAGAAVGVVSGSTAQIDASGDIILNAGNDVILSGDEVRVPGGFVVLNEGAASTPSLIAGELMLWAENTAPNRPMYTDDVNTDWALGYAASAFLTARTTTTANTTPVTIASFAIPSSSSRQGTTYAFSAEIQVSRGATATATNITLEFRVAGTQRLAITAALNVTNGYTGAARIDGEFTILGTPNAGTPITVTGVTTSTIISATVLTAMATPSIALTQATNVSIAVDIRASMSAPTASVAFTPVSGYIQRVAG
jgi:hypothetical protein